MSRCWDILHMVKYGLIISKSVKPKDARCCRYGRKLFYPFSKMILPRPYGSIQLHAW